jgi:hypothetical protein
MARGEDTHLTKISRQAKPIPGLRPSKTNMKHPRAFEVPSLCMQPQNCSCPCHSRADSLDTFDLAEREMPDTGTHSRLCRTKHGGNAAVDV